MTGGRQIGRWLLAAACLALVACDGPPRTIDRLRTEIATFKGEPSEALQRKIDEDFARLDAQIAELEKKNDAVNAAQFRSAAENLRSDYRTAKMMRSIQDAKAAVRDIGDALKDAGKSIGDAFRSEQPTPTPPRS